MQMPSRSNADQKQMLISLGDGASLAECLQPQRLIDSDHPDVIAFARSMIGNATSPVEKALRLYYAVRDKVRYDPYGTPMLAHAYKASTTLQQGHGYCINKAGLLAASARAVGIPSRVGYADVRNHLTTKRLSDLLGTDIFYYHGYTDLWLNGKWVKATPAFNIELTDKFKLKPLEWDGVNDSIYHAYDIEGRRHMEYLNYRGTYADIPFETIREGFNLWYPGMYLSSAEGAPRQDPLGGDFAKEAEAENAG